MKSFIVFALIIGAALAAPLESESEAVKAIAPLVAAGEAAKAVVLAPVVAAKAASEFAKDSEAPAVRAGYATLPLNLALSPDGQAVILRYENDNTGIGGYSWGYETSNGITHAEEAALEDNGVENPPSLAVIGQYSYRGIDGNQYTVFYRADKNGFQPKGDHLPVA